MASLHVLIALLPCVWTVEAVRSEDSGIFASAGLAPPGGEGGDAHGIYVETRTNLPSFTAEHTIEVFYGEAAIEVPGADYTTEVYDVFHSGMLFEVKGPGDSTPSQKFSLQWYAKAGMFAAMFPAGADAKGNLQWKSEAAVVYSASTDEAYWKRRMLVASMTGDKWDKYAEWVVDYSRKRNFYQMFAVQTKNDGDEGLQMTHTDTTCDSFSQGSIWELKKLHATMDSSAMPQRNYLWLLSNTPPERVDMSNAAEAKKVLEFYVSMKHTADSVLKQSELSMKAAKEIYTKQAQEGHVEAFIYDPVEGGYFKIILRPPFLVHKYADMPVPWRSKNIGKFNADGSMVGGQSATKKKEQASKSLAASQQSLLRIIVPVAAALLHGLSLLRD